MSLMFDAMRDLASQDPPSAAEMLADDIEKNVEGLASEGGLQDALLSALMLDAFHLTPIIEAARALAEPGSDLAKMIERADAYRVRQREDEARARAGRRWEDGLDD